MKGKKKALALAGVGALTLVGGTFAYYTAAQTFNNPFDTTNYGTSSVEKFNPSEGHDWKPGVEVDKKVFATNTGDGEVWVRVKLDEKWMRDNDTFIAFASGETNFNPASEVAGDHQPDLDADDGRLGNEDGLVNKTAGEGSVVYKKFVTDNIVDEANNTTAKKWYLKDGYYYYTSALVKNESTDTLLDSVTLCSDTDMGRFDENTYYKVVDKGTSAPTFDASEWTLGECDFDASLKGKTDDQNYQEKYGKYLDKDVYTYKENKLNEQMQGYANAGYELDITVEFVQADADAASAWSWYPGKSASAGTV